MNDFANLIRALATLAWPLLVGLAVIVFRGPLADLVKNIGKLRVKSDGPRDRVG